MNDKFLLFPASGWCLKGLREGGCVQLLWGTWVPLSVSDRLSFSPAHSRAVQPAAITTPLPLCHSNAMQSRGGEREQEEGETSTEVNEESRHVYPGELELDWLVWTTGGGEWKSFLGEFDLWFCLLNTFICYKPNHKTNNKDLNTDSATVSPCITCVHKNSSQTGEQHSYRRFSWVEIISNSTANKYNIQHLSPSICLFAPAYSQWMETGPHQGTLLLRPTRPWEKRSCERSPVAVTKPRTSHGGIIVFIPRLSQDRSCRILVGGKEAAGM